jgi:hypothetical protein
MCSMGSTGIVPPAAVVFEFEEGMALGIFGEDTSR